MSSIILEGGTFRPVFSAGVMDALLDNDIMFPYCIGVSAGITNGFSYISKQKERSYRILKNYRHDKRYIGAVNFLKCRSIFGLDFAFDEVPNKLDPFDFETFNKYDGKILVGVTNAETGKSEYMDGKELDEKCTMIRATCAIPLFFPPIKINNTDYFDGGLCDPIPIQKAINDGNKKHLIILTRPKGYVKTLSKGNVAAAKILNKKYPKLKDTFLTRHLQYNETVKFCEQLEAEGKAIILRPTSVDGIDSFEKDLNKITHAYEHGYNMAINRIDEIRSLLT
ncbi:MAG: patatin family protein [Clostridium sp.]|uniref:patatin-like phospholipase family protein n=1 Tax=Clostridium culturomicium TaxID=1499683 RepID=UPI00058B6032|nr:patatin family protein [Clostridium culturomicium]MDU4890421.1 patatin family protein [Clostridium sp.]MDU7084137.1 patatin family protein [Clostridium sp.]